MPGATQIAVGGAVIVGAGALLLASVKPDSDEKATGRGIQSIYWELPDNLFGFAPQTNSGKRIARKIMVDIQKKPDYKLWVMNNNGDIGNFTIKEWILGFIGIPYAAAKRLHDKYLVSPRGVEYIFEDPWDQSFYDHYLEQFHSQMPETLEKPQYKDVKSNAYLQALIDHLKKVTLPSITRQIRTTRFPATNNLIEKIVMLQINHLEGALGDMDPGRIERGYRELMGGGEQSRIGRDIVSFLGEISTWDPETNLPLGPPERRRLVIDPEVPDYCMPTMVYPFDAPPCCLVCAAELGASGQKKHLTYA